METSCLQHRPRVHPGESTGHKHTYNTTQEVPEYPGLILNGSPGPWAGVSMAPM